MPCCDATHHSCLWLKGAYLSQYRWNAHASQRVTVITALAKNIFILEFLNMTTFAIALTATLLGACIGVFSIALVAFAARPNRSAREPQILVSFKGRLSRMPLLIALIVLVAVVVALQGSIMFTLNSIFKGAEAQTEEVTTRGNLHSLKIAFGRS
jgi:hypothetical protein